MEMRGQSMPGGVPQVEIVVQHDALLVFGDAGFVSGFGLFFPRHGVDQGGFADVGDTAD